MKNLKKLFAVILTLAMCFAMSASVFAATITVENPQDSESYTAYKIFTWDTGDVYTLDASSAAYDLLIAQSKTDDGIPGAEIEEIPGVKGTYKADVTDAPSFAAWLKKNVGSLKSKIDAEVDGKTVTISANDKGYYFVNTSVGALAALTTVSDNITIYDKNEVPDITKKADTNGDSVEIGQVINYTITGTVPSTVGYDKYEYTVTDTMSVGLRFNEDVTISDNVKTYDDNGETKTVVAETNTEGTGFTLTFDMTKYQNKVGEEFTITYTATVNKSAVSVENMTNSASLTYSNNPGNSTSTVDAPKDIVTLYTSSIIINKYNSEYAADSTAEGAKLSGAEFVLKNANEGDDNYGKYYYYDSEKDVVSWVDDLTSTDPNVKVATRKTTNDSGAAQFDGLKNGKYELIETVAPTGFNLLTAPEKVELTGTTISNQPARLNYTANVANSAGSLLPSTGGIGTTIFYVVGGILVVAAGVLLVAKKRMSNR